MHKDHLILICIIKFNLNNILVALLFNKSRLIYAPLANISLYIEIYHLKGQNLLAEERFPACANAKNRLQSLYSF